MVTMNTLLSFQRDPWDPNRKEDVNSSQPRVGRAPDKYAATVMECESADEEDSGRICICENVLLP